MYVSLEHVCRLWHSLAIGGHLGFLDIITYVLGIIGILSASPIISRQFL